jgi:hypothetical protein
LILSFESRSIAQQALEKLDNYRKILLTKNNNINRTSVPTFNTLNRHMTCRNITPGIDYQLATTIPVQQAPKSRVDVIVNGSIHISCGVPDGISIGCYFTSVAEAGDPTKARVNDGDVQLGDQLYWIGSIVGFYVDDTYYLDFNFLF